MEVIRGNIYDYPKYYDVLFGSDWAAEYRFLRACFAQHAKRRVRRLFEPACGTGRLLARFARAGYTVSGLDLNIRAVEYCNRRLLAKGFRPSVFVGDMAGFRLPRPCDAAFNTINSFRHLADDRQALGHLRCMAAALKPGGLYVLGLHLTPAGRPMCSRESWHARRGHLSIVSRMWTVRLDRRRRREQVAFEFDVSTPTRQFRLADEFDFRTWSARQFERLLGQVPSLEVAATYDFAYDLEQPVTVCDDTEDVVFVLRKR